MLNTIFKFLLCRCSGKRERSHHHKRWRSKVKEWKKSQEEILYGVMTKNPLVGCVWFDYKNHSRDLKCSSGKLLFLGRRRKEGTSWIYHFAGMGYKPFKLGELYISASSDHSYFLPFGQVLDGLLCKAYCILLLRQIYTSLSTKDFFAKFI